MGGSQESEVRKRRQSEHPTSNAERPTSWEVKVRRQATVLPTLIYLPITESSVSPIAAQPSSIEASGGHKRKENVMLYWAAVFFVIALIAAILGFSGIAAGAASIAQVLFYIFLVIFLLSVILGLMRRPPRV